jgi:predicted MFS family arabinose efflux permease
MVTMQTVPAIVAVVGWRWAFPVLALGPALGFMAIRRLQQPAGDAAPPRPMDRQAAAR